MKGGNPLHLKIHLEEDIYMSRKEMEMYMKGNMDAKYARAEASRIKAEKKLEKIKKTVNVFLFFLISIETILFLFVRFCEYRFGSSCLKVAIASVLVTAASYIISRLFIQSKVRTLADKEELANYYLQKINKLAA